MNPYSVMPMITQALQNIRASRHPVVIRTNAQKLALAERALDLEEEKFRQGVQNASGRVKGRQSKIFSNPDFRMKPLSPAGSDATEPRNLRELPSRIRQGGRSFSKGPMILPMSVGPLPIASLSPSLTTSINTETRIWYIDICQIVQFWLDTLFYIFPTELELFTTYQNVKYFHF